MFDSIRSHRRWLMFFLVVLVFPSFVVTGIYSYNRMVGGEDVVAQIGDQQVLRQELDAAQREQMERLRGISRSRRSTRTCWFPQIAYARQSPASRPFSRAESSVTSATKRCCVRRA